jgi:hypothetical protein
MNARSIATPETATRHVGNCQICESDQKLHAGLRMVHHGYQRPGDGAIHGDCPGVDAAPYEVSCALIETHRAALQVRLVHLRARLADIQACRVSWFFRGDRTGRVLNGYAVGVTEPYRFARGLESYKWDVEGSIRQTEATIARFTARISAWRPQPVRTIEEVRRAAELDLAAKRAERDAAKAARAAKKAATVAKQAALAARRQAVVEGLVASLQALADQPASPERDAAAREIWESVKYSKKYQWLWLHELLKQGAEGPTLALGLTRRDPQSGRVLY